ncbi:hypothetical protein [Hymenobacter sp. DG01]|uniref:hypothetical protein n=1 Tax=Hymenobacter sp. DG01 TaxID=2584940 RepID=UPI00111CAF8C|nr:hypothetical protein [Hymenobacter sp. DG01]
MNNLQRPTLALTALLLISSGCVNLARRYRNKGDVYNMYNKLTPGQVLEYADISLVGRKVTTPAATPPANLPFVLALTDKGQAEYIKALSSKNDTAKVVLRNIMATIPPKKEVPVRVKVIPKVLTKALNFSVHRRASGGDPERGRYYIFDEADRISLLEFYLDIKDSSLVFNDWDRYVSVYGSVDLGKVTSAQNWSATANLSATAASGLTIKDTRSSSNLFNSLFSDSQTDKNTTTVTGTTNNGNSLNGVTSGNTTSNSTGAEATGVATSSNSLQHGGNTGGENTATSSFNLGPSVSATVGDRYETAQNLIFQRLALAGRLHEDSLFLRQEGAQGIDLSANTAVSVEYRTKAPWASPLRVDKFDKLFDKDSKPLLEGKLEPSFMFLLYPDVKKDVTGKFRYKYIYREVAKGSRHLPEARQKVKFQYGEVGFKADLAKNSNSKKDSARLANNDQALTAYKKKAIDTKAINKLYQSSGEIDDENKRQFEKNAAIEFYGKDVLLVEKNEFRPITYRLGISEGNSKGFITYEGRIMEFETLADATDFMTYVYYSVSSGNTLSKIKIQNLSIPIVDMNITSAMFIDKGKVKAITPLMIQN